MPSDFIEDYSFGSMIIDGKNYTDDVILLDEKVISTWWRKIGHRVVIEDLNEVIDHDPDVLIIGTGSSGRMKVPAELSKRLDMVVESYPTGEACKRYNELFKKDRKIAGAFHITC